MGLLEDVGSLLTAASVCSTGAGSTGWRLVYREFQPSPPSPVRQICLTLTGGFESEQRAPVTRPTFQARIRGSTSEGTALEAKVQALVTALNFREGNLGPQSWYYTDLRMQGDVLYLGRDEHQQPQYSVNFEATRSRTS